MTLYQYRTLIVDEDVLKRGEYVKGWSPEQVREWRKENRYDRKNRKRQAARIQRVKKRLGR